MRQPLSFGLAALLCIGFAACNDETDPSAATASGGSTTSTGAGGNGNGGSDGGNDGGNGGSTPATDCSGYCALAMGRCSGPDTLYDDVATCQTVCAAFPSNGADGDTSGDTLQCRISHLQAMDGHDTVVCGHAGVTGGDKCGTYCEVYCREAADNCTGAEQIFDDPVQCAAACAEFPVAMDESAADSVQCRINHISLAHEPLVCAHGSTTGGDKCGSYCDTYCRLALANCTGGDVLFADDAACQQACAPFPADGAPGDTSGDTVQCRITHVSAVHSNLVCAHGRPNSQICN